MPLAKKLAGFRSSVFSGKFIYQVVALSTAVFFLLICAVFLMVYSFFSHQEENASRSYIVSGLEQADSTLAVMLGGLRSEGEMILSADSVADILVDGWNRDPKLSYQTVEQMKRLCHASDLATDIFLYLVRDDVVLTSQSDCGSLSQYSSLQQSLLSGSQNGLVCREGEMYLVLPYPQQEPLARMVIKLDESVLRRALLNENSSIYVFDETLQPVFTSIRYPTDLKVHKILHKDSSLFSCTDTNGDYFVAYRSQTTHLIYLCRSRLYTIQSIHLSSLRRFLPAAMLLLAGAALYSVFLFERICAPIQQMLNLILRSAPQEDYTAHGLDGLVRSLNGSLSDLEKRSRFLSGAAASIAPQLLERLIRRILFEGLQDKADIEQQAEALQNAFPTGQPYVVFCITPWYSADDGVQKELLQIHLIYLQELAREYWQPLLPAAGLIGSDDRLVLVVSQSGVSNADWQLYRSRFAAFLEKSTAALAFEPLIGCSEALTGLWQLPGLYDEAVQLVNRAVYDRNSHLVKSQNPAEAAAPVWRRHLRTMLDAALKGQQAEATRALEELLQAVQSLESPAPAAAEIREQLSRRLEAVTGSPALLPAAQSAQDIRTLAAQTVSLLLQNSRESQMDYLESAQDCIARHYADASLSLDEVSRRVGISGPYLSSLFTSLTQEHFLDYLNRYRIERACELLQTTDLSVAEVGFQVGFNSASSFIRVFKKYRQVPPGTFRAKNAGAGHSITS